MTEATKSDQKYSQDDFKLMCEEDFAAAKSNLVDPEQFNFTPEGIAEYAKLKPEECRVFFGEILGEEFSVKLPDGADKAVLDDSKVTKLQEIVFANFVLAAKMMWFLYSSFYDALDEGKKEVEKSPDRKGRAPMDWKSMEIPFREKTQQHAVFEALLKYKGTRKAFIEGIPALLEAQGLKASKDPKGLLENITLVNAKERGYSVVFDKETDVYTITREQ